MRILLVRHGESEGNVDPQKYIEKGDQSVELTEQGWWQAQSCGRFLARLYAEKETKSWPLIFLSPYTRTLQTASGTLKNVHPYFGSDPKLYQDPRLIEKFFGAASALEFPPEGTDPELAQAINVLSKYVYKGDPFSAAHLFGESTSDTMIRLKSFIDGTLKRDIDEGNDDFLIITHGAVIKAFIANWFHVPMQAIDQIETPGNTDVFCVEGESKNWSVHKVYNGETGEAVNINPLENVRHLTYANLPSIPEKLSL